MKSSNFPCILLLKPKERTVQNMSIILKTTNLCKSFNGQTAVNNISLNIERNSVYGLLGPNGAGKSTTLKMITGILRPTSGSIEFDGHAWKRSDLNHFSETAYSKLNGDNKELLIIPGANHTDLYDQMDIIPFEKLNAFFTAYLR